MKVCIVGAGPSGLLSARYALEAGFECEVFEQMGKLGGLWNYLDKDCKDANGQLIQNAMYQNLRTNLPKECMIADGFPYPSDLIESIIPQSQVLEYYHRFTDHFNLFPFIKFYHRVIVVKPMTTDRWEVTVKDLSKQSIKILIFDAIIICSGIHYLQFLPTIPGKETFCGTQLHSFFFKTVEPYKNQKVVIVGAGPSGMDLARHLCEVADKVFLSHRKADPVNLGEDRIVEKPEIIRIRENEVEFKDGGRQEVDVIIYATGYSCNYPFLSKECKINVDGRWIQYLYKDVANIEYPTMCFVGTTFSAFVLDLQARFAISLIDKNASLPDRKEMMNEIEERLKKMKRSPQRDFHWIEFPEMKVYLDDVADAGKIARVPTVLIEIFWDYLKHANDVQKPCYRVVDANTFEVVAHR